MSNEQTHTERANIGVVGLAVMGANLARNLASREGNTVAVYNRSPERTRTLLEQHPEGGFVASESIDDFVASLAKPRTAIVLVQAGPGTDAVIEQLAERFEPGDIIVEGGNANFHDTIRREQDLRKRGPNFVGAGISGGEEGALGGPSIMPGGYDRARPTPPPALLDLLTQLIHLPHPALVVDLCSGTGLSTAIWGERAERVIGIEPNADMRKEAVHTVEDHPYAATIEYREGLAHQTGLPSGCADIVTAAQSLHWMEPTATLAEIARLLRPGGFFAAYDYDWPPTLHWELDRLAQEVGKRFVELVRERGLAHSLKMWSKDRHLDRMRESAHFRFTREVLLHQIEQGDAARFLEMMRSNAFSHQFQFTEQEIGFDRRSLAAFQSLGSEPIPWYVSYRVRVGIK